MLTNCALHPPLVTNLCINLGRADWKLHLKYFLAEKLRFYFVFSKASSSWKFSLGITKILLFTCSCLTIEECRPLGFIIIYNMGQLRG